MGMVKDGYFVSTRRNLCISIPPIWSTNSASFGIPNSVLQERQEFPPSQTPCILSKRAPPLDATFTFRTKRVLDQPPINTIAMKQVVTVQMPQLFAVLEIRETDCAFLVTVVEHFHFLHLVQVIVGLMGL